MNAVKQQDADTQVVMIVEDADAERSRLTALVAGMGHHVLEASHGQEALGILSSEHVDIILSDWKMPELSGLDLCRQVKGELSWSCPYFIMLTSRNQTCDLVAGMDAGADDFITKPVHKEELRVRLQAGLRALEIRRLLKNRYHDDSLIGRTPATG